MNSPEYYQRRADHARALAAQATSPDVRRIHLDLASRYDELQQESAGAVRAHGPA